MTWVMTRRQPEWNSALVSQTSFGGKKSSGVSKCRLFTQIITARDSIFLHLKTFANKQWKFVKEDYNFPRICWDRKPFSHALNITILVKEKGIIGGWLVKPSTCIKSECAFEL